MFSTDMGEQFDKKIKSFKAKYGDKQFTYTEAIAFGFSHAEFYRYVKDKIFERIHKATYRFDDYLPLTQGEQFRDALKLLGGSSAICLTSALSYYRLTDMVITKPWILVDHSTTSRSKIIQLFRKRDPMWDIGIEKMDGFKITSLERTIVESIAYRNTLTGYDGIYALRKAIFQQKVKLHDLYKIAKKLGYNKRIDGVLEAYLDEGE